MTGLPRLLRRLRASQSGAAALEFALAAPLLLGAGLYGVETANLAVTQMRISQVAVLLADNGSRVGENSLLGEVKIFESDVNDVLQGAHLQGGDNFGLYEHGRVIISSLQVLDDTEDQQYIHWQRCKGKKRVVSSYGVEDDGRSSGLPGMGPAGEEIYAIKDEAVIFVEVQYDYQPIVSKTFANVETLSAIAAFNVRANRDLSQIYQRDPVEPDPVAECDTYDGMPDIEA
ncbi:hypothetical protein [Qipengyuania sp. JC766]|uniref:hypothetical protein n=1 Tax=Qipengyuania sp. JC766 TaxID=3232139 RepID=UPI0034579ABB